MFDIIIFQPNQIQKGVVPLCSKIIVFHNYAFCLPDASFCDTNFAELHDKMPQLMVFWKNLSCLSFSKRKLLPI